MSDLKTILIVEDEYSIRESLKEMLEGHGYNVVTAVNGSEGLDKLHAAPKPCLVLLDMMMPVMTGQQFLECVRADVSVASIPVIVVSVTATSSDATGARAIMKKPPDLSLLLKLVEQYSA